MDITINIERLINWLFGAVAVAIGVINTFWGNDPGYGAFIFLLSFAYLPPASAYLKQKTGLSIPPIVKILMAIFILWTALGVAELPEKIDLMLMCL